MLYTYECPEHGEFDVSMPVEDMKSEYDCPQCKRMCKKVIVPGHGGIQCDSINDVAWLPSAIQTLPNDAVDKVQSRSDHRKYLKDHNMVQVG